MQHLDASENLSLHSSVTVRAGISSVLTILYQPHAAITPGKTMLALLQGRYYCKELFFLLGIRKATQNLCFLFSNKKKKTESKISHIKINFTHFSHNFMYQYAAE